VAELTNEQREALAEAHYNAVEWSGCEGSKWERVPVGLRRRHYDVADALAPVVADMLAAERERGRAEVKAAVEEWFTDVSLDDLFAVKGWSK
jgi:hypothetical protein